MSQKLSQFIEPPAGAKTESELWANISAAEAVQRTRRASYERLMWPLVGCAAVAGLTWGIGAFLIPSSTNSAESLPAPIEARPLEKAANAPALTKDSAPLHTETQELQLKLTDGSELRLSPHSRLAMREGGTNQIILNLESGKVECDVAKDPNRLFSVLAGGVTVRVIGTRFSVEQRVTPEGTAVEVLVKEGIVEVSAPDRDPKRLAQGETWSVQVPNDVAPEAEQAAAAAAPTSPSQKTQEVRAKPPVDARALFEKARAARHDGKTRESAQLYEQLLASFGGSPLAGVAALELGRLRMDELGDPQGALAPLNRAAASAAGGLGDDALARLVRVHSQLGQTQACSKRRAQYIRKYPQGVHVEQVRSLCGGKR